MTPRAIVFRILKDTGHLFVSVNFFDDENEPENIFAAYGLNIDALQRRLFEHIGNPRNSLPIHRKSGELDGGICFRYHILDPDRIHSFNTIGQVRKHLAPPVVIWNQRIVHRQR